MCDLNKKLYIYIYIYILIEYGIPETNDSNKKYIKDLLTKCIENINFIRPPRSNESESLLLNEPLVVRLTPLLISIPTGILI